MTIRWFLIGLMAGAALPALADTATTPDPQATPSKSKLEIIRLEDKHGTVEEARVPAVGSEIRYLPNDGGKGYHLVDANGAQGKGQDAHRNDGLLIPSWQVLNW